MLVRIPALSRSPLNSGLVNCVPGSVSRISDLQIRRKCRIGPLLLLVNLQLILIPSLGEDSLPSLSIQSSRSRAGLFSHFHFAFMAIMDISTFAPLTNLAICTQARAGGLAAKYVA